MDTIHLIAPLLPSVGRINGLGSCIVLSMTPDTTGDPSKCRAILLTTSHCLTRRVDAHGLEAIFFENPMEGSFASAGGQRRSQQQQPVVVLLRPESVFITSAEDPKAKKNIQQLFTQPQQQQQQQQQQQATPESSIGYTIVACDVEGRDVSAAAPPNGRNNYNSNNSNQEHQNMNNNNNHDDNRFLSSNSTDNYGYDSDSILRRQVAHKYRPLFDPKAIERAAQHRVDEQRQKQQQQQQQVLLSLQAAQNEGNPDQPTPKSLLLTSSSSLSGPHKTTSTTATTTQPQPPPTIASIIPVGLPLLQCRCPGVNKGDRHLVVTHAAGGPTRKIYTLTVAEAHDNYCVYNEVDATVMFSSGGIVFSTAGEFIGVQHQSPGPDCSHYCMFIKEITQHLYVTHSLSSIQIPILDGNVEDVDGMVGTVAKSVFDRDLFILGEDPLWKRQRDALIRGNPVDQDMLNRASPESGILAGEARTMHVRTKARYGGNYAQLIEFSELQREQNLRKRYIPKTLLVCDHLEVFNAYYQPNNYSSLVHMVGSFGYHPELTKMILTKLVSHEHRNDLATFSEFQGMPPLLETLERNGANADITQAGVTALGRLTQFELNREALNRYNGLQTLIAILQGWPHHVQIIEWGCFCLMNMTEKSTLRAKENVKAIADSEQGLILLCGFVKNLGVRGPSTSAHICRWALTALSNLIGDDKSLFDQAMQQGNDLCGVVVDSLVQFCDSSYALYGVSTCFLTLVHLELFDAAVDFFINAGALSRVLAILHSLSSAAMSNQASSFLCGTTPGGASVTAFGSPTANLLHHRYPENFSSAKANHVGSGGSVGSSSSFGSAADVVVAQNFLTALHHIVEQRPHVKTDLVYLGAVEIASSFARVFAKEGELVNIVASLISALK